MNAARDDLVSIAASAVDLALETIRAEQANTVTVTGKGDRDMASSVDFQVERQLRSFLAAQTPSIGMLGEEEGRTGPDGSGPVWVLDPVDGTVNFLHGLPLSAVSLALVEDDQPVLGVIALPYLGQRYWAAAGQGAYSQDKRISIRRAGRLADALVSVGDYAVGEQAAEKNRVRLAVTDRLIGHVQRIRMLGSAAIDLAWVAEGKLDACVMMANKPWDTAAGVIIAREAGACVMDAKGQEHSMKSAETIAVSAELREDLLTIVAGR